MTDETLISVCVCTFRRQSLAETLRSLARQAVPPRHRVAVVVADNDTEPSARDLANRIAAECGLDLTYVHAPAGNISIARNAALRLATGDWLAFIDDDEEAGEGWLSALIAAADREGADIVLGPVLPVFDAEAPEWMKDGRFHAIFPTIKRGQVTAGYTSNALVRASILREAGLEFDPALGRSGGEDTAFFDTLIGRGARICFAPEAAVSERVPPERARLGWLLRRRYRSGQTHGMILLRSSNGPASRSGQVLLALTKAGVSAAGFVLSVFSPRQRAFWLLRASLHLGVVSRLLGQAEILQYGQTGPEG